MNACRILDRLWEAERSEADIHLRSDYRQAYVCVSLASIVMVQTAAGPGEVLRIRLGDIDWQNRVLKIRGTKTDYRADELHINENCLIALRELEALAAEKGAILPEHYLFPHRAATGSQGADPTRPREGFNKAWSRLRAEAAKKYPRLARCADMTCDTRHCLK